MTDKPDVSVSAELAVFPVFFIGGAAHGQCWLWHDRPLHVSTPRARGAPSIEFNPGQDFYEPQWEVEEYHLERFRVGSFNTDWWYYCRDGMDEGEGALMLWAFLWETALRIARAGGWEKRNVCQRCNGTGVNKP